MPRVSVYVIVALLNGVVSCDTHRLSASVSVALNKSRCHCNPLINNHWCFASIHLTRITDHGKAIPVSLMFHALTLEWSHFRQKSP